MTESHRGVNDLANGPLAGGPRFAPDADLMKAEQKGPRSSSAVTQPQDRLVMRRPRNDEPPFLVDGDMLDVINDGHKPVIFRWARRRYVVEVGEQAFVPFEALVDALGDPRSVENATVRYDDGAGNRGLVASRYEELVRLFAHYAVQGESVEDLVSSPHVPKVRVFTLAGQQVFFPCSIPDATALPVANADEGHVNADVTRMIDKVRGENTDLKARLDALESALEETYRERETAAKE
jgi:hypothetical protein